MQRFFVSAAVLCTAVVGACNPCVAQCGDGCADANADTAVDVDACREVDDQFGVGGERGADGVVDVGLEDGVDGAATALVIAAERGDVRVQLQLRRDELDVPRGPVNARWGRISAGEGDEVGYVELVDDGGLFFAGGRLQVEDGNATGSALVDDRLGLGEATGVRCASDVFGDRGVDALHLTRIALDGGAVELDDGERVDGAVDGVAVIAVGSGAGVRTFLLDDNVADGPSRGCHTFAGAAGYVVRAAVAGD